MHTFARQLLMLLAFSLALPLAYATILNNGDIAPPSFLSVGSGSTLEGTISGTITTNTFTATFTEWVYSDPSNTFCVGCLDFVYQFTNNGPDVLERFTMYNFAGFQVDAGYDPATGSHAPVTVNRSLNGTVIGFNYTGSDQVGPGETTPLLLIETDARAFTSGYVTAQDGNAGFHVAYAPSAVPEPSSLGLLGSGLVVVGGFLRKLLPPNHN